MSLPRISVALSLFVTSACANSVTPTDAGAMADAILLDGGGVCCPRSDACTHAGGLLAGGWAQDLASCPAPDPVYDGVWGDILVNGCPAWESHGITPRNTPGEVVCGRPQDTGPSQVDAGASF